MKHHYTNPADVQYIADYYGLKTLFNSDGLAFHFSGSQQDIKAAAEALKEDWILGIVENGRRLQLLKPRHRSG